MLLVPSLQAQGKTEVFILGKNKGTVSSMQAGGSTLVDARATAKKLGGSVELFSASKQMKISFPGIYTILSVSSREVVINAGKILLPTEVISAGGKMYVPVQFFLLPQVQQALDRQITFENHSLVVERNYQLALAVQNQTQEYDEISLFRKGDISFSAKEPNKHTVQIVFPNTVLKRYESQRPKDDFIRSFTLSQRGQDTILEIILGNKGKVWKVSDEGGKWLVRVSAKEVTPSPAATALAPSVIEENQTAARDEEDAEELDLEKDLTPVLLAGASTTPVLSAANPPTISAANLPVIRADHKIRIVVDPGHGGKDAGAVRRASAREKDLNLAVGKHLYNYLKKQGFEVKLTRDNDTFITLGGRSKMSNEFKADLFISVHTNATKSSSANGFEVYFRSEKPTDQDAAEIAAFENEALQYEETHYSFVDKLLQSLAKNEYMNESSKLASHVRNYVYKEPGIGIAVNQKNAIKQANFYVLRGVQAPAILVEMGYISSPKDRARLNNKSAQKRMGEGIGKGVVAYLKAEGRIK